MKHLYPPQQEHLRVLLEAQRNHGVSLDASITGAGKTLVAVEQCRAMGLSGFVVCPKSVITQWERTFAEQGVPMVAAVTWEKLRTGRTPWCMKDGRKGFRFTLPDRTGIILDEVHRGKALHSLNANMVVAAKRQRLPVMALSATAAENPAEMRALGYLLGLHDLKGFMVWARANGCRLNPWNGLEFPAKNRKFLDKLNKEIYPSRGHKLTRGDMGGFFTTTSITTDPVDFGDRLRECYTEMDRQLAELAERAAGDSDKAEALTAQLRARQKVELLKVPLIAEETVDAVGQGRSVAVFVNFHESLEAVAARLGMPCSRVEGGQTKAERDRQIEAFQNDEVHVVVCNTAAGGQSISLHDTRGKRPRSSLISPSWNAKDIYQCLGRIDRAGALTDTVQRIFFAAGTIEEDVCNSLQKKLLDLDTLHAKNGTPADTTPAHTMENLTVPQAAEGTPPGKTQDTGPSAHHEFGPSTLNSTERCPGFANEQGESPAARMGTRLHAALETGDPGSLEDDYEKLLFDMVMDAVAEIRTIWYGDNPVEEHREARVGIDVGLPGDLNPFGTADRIMVGAGRAVLIDYKFGRVPVAHAATNVQGIAYAAGVMQMFPQVAAVEVYFLQPRLDEVSHATFTRDALPAMVLRIRNIISKAVEARGCLGRGMDPGTLRPDASTCIYCRNIARCHAVAGLMAETTSAYEPDMPPLPAGSVHGSDMDDPAVFAALLPRVAVAEKWAAGMRQRGQEFARNAIKVPGYEAVERQGRRTVTGPLAAADALKGDVSIEEILSVATVSFASLADLYAEKAPPRKKAVWKKQLENKLADCDALGRGQPYFIWRKSGETVPAEPVE